MSGTKTPSTTPRSGSQSRPAHRRSGSKTWASQANGARKHTAENAATARLSGDELYVASKHMDDRLLFALARSIGSKATVTVGSGTRYMGVLLSTSDLEPAGMSVALKYPEVDYLAPGEEKESLPETLIIQAKDVMSVEVVGVDLETVDTSAVSAVPVSIEAEKPSGFRTDTDISGFKQTEERELQKWVPEDGDELTFGGLEDDNGGRWDQFEVNEKKFGIQSTFDEHLYTTKINKEAPNYKERLREAERLAKEIESQGFNGNIHLAEERGLVVDDSGMDEEDKYSGVDRTGVDKNGGSALMGILKSNAKNATPSELKPIVQGKYATPNQRAANYHNDPAIIASSAVEKKAPSIPSKPPQVATAPKKAGAPATFSSDASRINAQSEINSLKEFAANFKVPQKFPPDLLPILSKDKAKQQEILKKVEGETEKKAESKEGSKEKSSKEEKPKETAKEEKPKKKIDMKSVTPFKMNPASASFSPMGGFKDARNSPMALNAPLPNTRPKKHGTAQSFFGSKIPKKRDYTEKILQTSFNVLLTTKEKGKLDNFGMVDIEKPYVTLPTWQSSIDESYTKIFAPVPERVSVSSHPRQFYGSMPPMVPTSPTTGMPPMMPPMMQMMPQPMFDDRQQRFFPHMQPGQFMGQPNYIPVQGGMSPTGQPVPMYSPVPGVIPMMNTRGGSKQGHYNGGGGYYNNRNRY